MRWLRDFLLLHVHVLNCGSHLKIRWRYLPAHYPPTVMLFSLINERKHGIGHSQKSPSFNLDWVLWKAAYSWLEELYSLETRRPERAAEERQRCFYPSFTDSIYSIHSSWQRVVSCHYNRPPSPTIWTLPNKHSSELSVSKAMCYK